ncbi:acyl transferase/acyl hydrolase/lysophospholipase [Cercophora scortea]|uniref:Acyl transferase/acyl hydrolase/lysophospholipase n=1 Tax=Cercophora scortea TaxID=314031 RepID=A0AAE0IP78_9PEZI|nr:acyl transferase/acyl hydrolase/lysophospholipase [Cercophora scortea]
MSPTGPIWSCTDCDKYLFCDLHWGDHLPHRQPKRTSSRPHQKIDGKLGATIMRVLQPPRLEELDRLHHENEITAWFGTSQLPILRDYGRLAELMIHQAQAVAPDERNHRAPSLVSFVGGTGAGKSTLIKLLIVLGQATASPAVSPDQAPVMGRTEVTTSTSEDVHLYQDPETAKTNRPILFADCEGLGGSEPQATKSRKTRQWLKTDKGEATGAPPSKPLEDRRALSERPLKWEKKDGEDRWSREYFVRHLYPRLLYTFSDAVVYVLGGSNHRTMRNAVLDLITWAEAAVRTSSNQPVLPVAIIVLNSSDNDISPHLWDVSTNTKHAVMDLGQINYEDTADELVRFAKSWPNSPDGTGIGTVEELALRYYSSIQIVRLPAKEQSGRMSIQAMRLRSCISDACEEARKARVESRMLLDVEELQVYFQDALSHYARTLDEPFDFVQASFRHRPVSDDFSGNVLRLALNVTDATKGIRPSLARDPERAFYEVGYVVASSIMLNSTRHHNKGNSAELFAQYAGHLKKAVQGYRDIWPCEFELNGHRCVNTRFGHAKGHQSRDGRPLAHGVYVCNVDWTTLEDNFRECVGILLTQLLVLLKSETLTWRTPTGPDATPQEHLSNSQKAAMRIHRERMLPNFLRRVTEQDGEPGSCPLSDQKSCLYCLAGKAEHPLPCGHIICQACVEASGEWTSWSRSEMAITKCPIGCLIQRRLYGHPWLVHLKPASTGARVMSLDGGGIRGIAELEVLLQIEQALGGKIPIQSFFDLIVGTSTGGLIALGLTAMNWTVPECIQRFETLCNDVFTKRSLAGGLHGHKLWLIWEACMLPSRYKTKPLENALKEAFTEELCLFGNPTRIDAQVFPTKVAVTATEDRSALRTHVLANYNYPAPEKRPGIVDYHFLRPDRRLDEIKVWEAARATSAAPAYFKPFLRPGSPGAYIDGALFHNNPAKIANEERKRLWPETDQPDILLSLGTGKPPETDHHRGTKRDRRAFTHMKTKIELLSARIDVDLDCDRAWGKFMSEIIAGTSQSEFGDQSGSSNYFRLNPDVSGELPKLDDKNKMGDFRLQVREWAEKREPANAIERVARQLIAASFYFETANRVSPQVEGDSEVVGKPDPGPLTASSVHNRFDPD